RSKRDWSSDVCSSDLQINKQNHQRGNRHDRFRHRQLENVEVAHPAHKAPAFLSPSNSGESKLGRIKSRSRRGYRPMTSVVAIKITAPIRSGIEIGPSASSDSRRREEADAPWVASPK